MRLARFVDADAERPRVGRVEGEMVVPLEAATVLEAPRASVAGAAVPIERVRLLAPLAPRLIVCVGRNYRDHVGEKSLPIPERPLIFAKPPSAVIGPGEAIVRPAATAELDLECELAVVIGARAAHLEPGAAPSVVFGYTILNDVSARDLQRTDGQWLRAKGSDTFAPIGPWVVTAEELDPSSGIALRSSVKGVPWQDSTTREMIFDIDSLLAFITASITLVPGDLVATGTPAGVGQYRTPPAFLGPGDTVRCEIEGIGVLENLVR